MPATGVHIARQDSTPDDPVHRPGRPRRRASARRSRRSTTGRCSAASPNGWPRSTIRAASRNSSRRAFHTATSGRPGPVVLALPEDMLTETAAGAEPPPYSPTQAHPGAGVDRHPARPAGGGRAAARASSAAAAGTPGPAPTSALRRGRRPAGRRVVPAPGLLRQPHHCYAGDVGIGSTAARRPRARRRPADRSSGPGSAR